MLFKDKIKNIQLLAAFICLVNLELRKTDEAFGLFILEKYNIVTFPSQSFIRVIIVMITIATITIILILFLIIIIIVTIASIFIFKNIKCLQIEYKWSLGWKYIQLLIDVI